jgi:hypothetical protein
MSEVTTIAIIGAAPGAVIIPNGIGGHTGSEEFWFFRDALNSIKQGDGEQFSNQVRSQANQYFNNKGTLKG